MNAGGEFFAALAHEVKTPLAVLRGYAELLATREDEETRRSAPPAMLEAAERLGTAVDDLLLVLEIDAETFELERERVEVGTVSLAGDARLLRRVLDVLGRENLSARVEGDRATLTADGAKRSRVDVYLARRIAELHGGELLEGADGLVLTLPLAT